MTTRNTLPFALLVVLLTGSRIVADERPITGEKDPAFEPLDRAILQFMDRVDCQAATVAVSKGGRLLYSRGYGWRDRNRMTPTPPDALMRIASVSKSITAAAVKALIRDKKLRLDDKVFELLKDIKAPGGKPADPRLKQITVAHLLEHRGGWDKDEAFDPMFRVRQIKRVLRLTTPVRPGDVVRYMLTQPLQFDPGERSAYSNFGYCVLGRVVERVTGKQYIEHVRQSVCEPLKIEDIRLGRGDSKRREPREVWYPVRDGAFSLDVMDAHGGLIASAPALCRFLDAYWISGEPRQPGQRQNWVFIGSLQGTTAMVRQRPDGVNVAVLFNGRRNAHFNEDNELLRKEVDEAIDAVLKKGAK